MTASTCLRYLLLISLGSVGCTTENPDYCDATTSCGAGFTCDQQSHRCIPMAKDAAGDASHPSDLGAEGGAPDGANSDQLQVDADGLREDGTACSDAKQCKSGHCVDKVCCKGACDGPCLSCALTGSEGRCVPVKKGDDPDNDCTPPHAACGQGCDGEGGCVFAPDTESCGTPSCSEGKLTVGHCDGSGDCASKQQSCGGYACADAKGCKTSCSTAADCVAPFQCIDDKCVSNLPVGSACGTNGAACESGNCVDGVCCTTSNCPACQACDLNGKGTCSAVKDGQGCGAASCSGGITSTFSCEGGACKTTTKSCGLYTCNSVATKCRTSCQPNQCVTGAWCNTGESKCQPKKGNGVPCGHGLECRSSLCTAKEKVCCDKACAGECESCSGLTECTIKSRGAACGVGKPPCQDTAFRSFFITEECNGSSSQCSHKEKDCAPYMCGSGRSCKASCVSGTECTTGFCSLNKCVAESDICWVDNAAAGARTQNGTFQYPYDRLGECFKLARKYTLVRPGTYKDHWGISATGSTRVIGMGSGVIFDVGTSSETYAIRVPGALTLSIENVEFRDSLKSNKVRAITDNAGTVLLDGVKFKELSGEPVVLGGAAAVIKNTFFERNAGAVICNSDNVTLEEVSFFQTGQLEISYVETAMLDGVYVDRDNPDAGTLANGIHISHANTVSLHRVGVRDTTLGLFVEADGQASNIIVYGNTNGFRAHGRLFLTHVFVYQLNTAMTCLADGVGPGGIPLIAPTTTVSNSIVWSDAQPTAYDGKCVFSHSNVKGGPAGTGNISVAPSIISTIPLGPLTRWYISHTTNWQHFNSGTASPDGVALPTVDFFRNPRAVGAPDMGAYEKQ